MARADKVCYAYHCSGRHADCLRMWLRRDATCARFVRSVIPFVAALPPSHSCFWSVHHLLAPAQATTLNWRRGRRFRACCKRTVGPIGSTERGATTNKLLCLGVGRPTLYWHVQTLVAALTRRLRVGWGRLSSIWSAMAEAAIAWSTPHAGCGR